MGPETILLTCVADLRLVRRVIDLYHQRGLGQKANELVAGRNIDGRAIVHVCI